MPLINSHPNIPDHDVIFRPESYPDADPDALKLMHYTAQFVVSQGPPCLKRFFANLACRP